MAVICIVNHKGGVGKTTTAVNLGDALRELGKRVLLVDFDPQASLTVHLGLKRPETLPASAGQALLAAVNGDHRPDFRESLIKSSAGVDLIPAGSSLADVEPLLGQATDWASTLRTCLEPLRDAYDFILIDCLPSRTYLAYTAMAAADTILIPTQADYLAVQGLESTVQSALLVRQKFNPSLRILGILLTMVDHRTKHSRWVISAIRRGFEGKIRVFETMIGLQVSFKDSSKDGISILGYSATSGGAMAYRNLAREVVAATETVDGIHESRFLGSQAAQDEVIRVAVHDTEGLARAGKAIVSASPEPPTKNHSTSPVDVLNPTPPNAVNHALDSSAPTQFDPNSRSSLNWGPHVCPFLGLVEDQRMQLDHPDSAHRCWVNGTPFLVDIEQQQTVCQQRWFWSCPRYGPNAFGAPNSQTAPSLISRMASWFRLHR